MKGRFLEVEAEGKLPERDGAIEYVVNREKD